MKREYGVQVLVQWPYGTMNGTDNNAKGTIPNGVPDR